MNKRIPLDAMTSDQLDALYGRADTAEAWRRKAVRRALAVSRLAGTVQAVAGLANEQITEQGPWGDGYRAALTDLREALDAFQPREAAPITFADGPTLAEDITADRNWDLRKAGE